jgi:hypothetical protein
MDNGGPVPHKIYFASYLCHEPHSFSMCVALDGYYSLLPHVEVYCFFRAKWKPTDSGGLRHRRCRPWPRAPREAATQLYLTLPVANTEENVPFLS